MTNGETATIEEERVIVRPARGTTTRGDAETTALVRIFRLLDGLDEHARARVVQYIDEKYSDTDDRIAS